MKDELATLMRDLPRPDTDRKSPYSPRVGTVSSDSPVEVQLAASDDGLPTSYLITYTVANPPQVDDQVLILQGEGDMIILGKIQSGG